jgi:hypothetical protein
MILATAFADLVELDKLSGVGAVSLFRKPIDTGQLTECVERRLPDENRNLSSSETSVGMISGCVFKMSGSKTRHLILKMRQKTPTLRGIPIA